MSTPRHTPSPAHPSGWSGPKPPNTPSDPVSKFPARPSGSPYFGRGLVGGPGAGGVGWDFEGAVVVDQSSVGRLMTIDATLPEHDPGDELFIFLLSEKSCSAEDMEVPAGWTRLAFVGSTGTNTNNSGSYIIHKTADASEPEAVTLSRASDSSRLCTVAVRASGVPTEVQDSATAGPSSNVRLTTSALTAVAPGYQFVLGATGNTRSNIAEVFADPPMTLLHRATGEGGDFNMSGVVYYEPVEEGLSSERRVEWSGSTNGTVLTAII